MLDEQTCHFWHLQLQFFDMDELSLFDLFTGIKHSSIYKKNKFTEKFEKMLDVSYQMSEKDIECLSTHLALQLSGIEE
jgi:hypothetical protein